MHWLICMICGVSPLFFQTTYHLWNVIYCHNESRSSDGFLVTCDFINYVLAKNAFIITNVVHIFRWSLKIHVGGSIFLFPIQWSNIHYPLCNLFPFIMLLTHWYDYACSWGMFREIVICVCFANNLLIQYMNTKC